MDGQQRHRIARAEQHLRRTVGGARALDGFTVQPDEIVEESQIASGPDAMCADGVGAGCGKLHTLRFHQHLAPHMRRQSLRHAIDKPGCLNALRGDCRVVHHLHFLPPVRPARSPVPISCTCHRCGAGVWPRQAMPAVSAMPASAAGEVGTPSLRLPPQGCDARSCGRDRSTW